MLTTNLGGQVACPSALTNAEAECGPVQRHSYLVGQTQAWPTPRPHSSILSIVSPYTTWKTHVCFVLTLHFVDYQNNKSALYGALTWKPVRPRKRVWLRKPMSLWTSSGGWWMAIPQRNWIWKYPHQEERGVLAWGQGLRTCRPQIISQSQRLDRIGHSHHIL